MKELSQKIEHFTEASSTMGISNTDIALSMPQQRTPDATIKCYQNEIPAFVEQEIERLYGNIFSSLKRLSTTDAVINASTYVVMKNGAITTLFLFRQLGKEIKVVNEVIQVSDEAINQFASYIFSTFKSAQFITFTSVEAQIRKLDFVFQQFNSSENIVVSLPNDAKTYWSSLGKSTRHNINYYRNKFVRDYQPFSFDVFENQVIDERQFKEIISLSRARLHEKNKVLGWNAAELDRLFQFAKVAGLMTVISINGKICAGAIAYRAGDNYCLEVIAHDPALNDYRLGTLCCYLTICECINRGAKEFHFLWGQYDYKYRFLGVQRDLYNIKVYRSHAALLSSPAVAFKMQSSSVRRQIKLWMTEEEKKEKKSWAYKLLATVKNLKAAKPQEQTK